MTASYIKTKRAFSLIRTYGWLLTILIAIGGLWVPKLGLLVIPIMLALTLTSLFKGRFWCGNFCPHGSFYDVIMQQVSLNKKIPSFLKSKYMLLLFFTWFLFNLGRKLLTIYPTFGTEQFLNKLGFIFVTTYLMVLIVGGILSIIIAPRAWCHFCPMGIIQTFMYRLGKKTKLSENTDKKITIASKEMCYQCGKCAKVCPMQLSPYTEFSEQNQFDHEKCIRCSTCVYNCPANILSLEKQADDSKIETAAKQYPLKN